MAQTFPRWLGTEEDLPTGMFTTNTPSRRAVMSCPTCGNVFPVPSKCGPDEAGRSLYAIHCEARTCGWWDFAVFESIWEDAP